MRRKLVLPIAYVLTSCATPANLVKVDYGFLDSPSDQHIELSYRNKTPHTMCLLPEHWPNQAGKINQGSDRMVLVAGAERFPVEDFNTGYCPEGCPLRVAPGAELLTSVSYAEFALPERLWGAAKTLEFAPLAYACSSR